MCHPDLQTKIEFEILPGLPGEGDPPRYFSFGHPTPWSEGLVVSCQAENTRWVGNFQEGHSGYTSVAVWHQANVLVVIASGNCYVIDALHPAKYRALQSLVSNHLILPDRELLLVVDYADIFAYSPSLKVVWKTDRLALDGIEITEVDNDHVYGTYCFDPDHEWRDFCLRLSDGQKA